MSSRWLGHTWFIEGIITEIITDIASFEIERHLLMVSPAQVPIVKVGSEPRLQHRHLNTLLNKKTQF
jgi:hypothetical protein